MVPHGRLGGILVRADLSYYDIGAINDGHFYVKSLLSDKSGRFKFSFYMLNGPAQQQHKEAFLIDMANAYSWETFP